jgi:hypothetical protein
MSSGGTNNGAAAAVAQPASASTAAAAGPKAGYQDDESYQSHLQKLLLDAIAASHVSCGRSIEALIK